MNQEEIIISARTYLNEPLTEHLFRQANNTNDIKIIYELVATAKIIYGSYISDANYWQSKIKL